MFSGVSTNRLNTMKSKQTKTGSNLQPIEEETKLENGNSPDKPEKPIYDFTKTLVATLESLDPTKEVEIIPGCRSDPRETLNIQHSSQLGGGGQACVYKCRVVGLKGYYADKVRRVYNSTKLADKELREHLSEFLIGKDLYHPNIIEFKYFVRKRSGKNQEFHIVMELMRGEDMLGYLSSHKDQARDINFIRKIGGQILSAVKYLHDNHIVHQDLKPQNIIFSKE